MKKAVLASILTALILSSLSVLSVYADEIPVPVEEVITEVNSQAHAIDAYQMLEQSLKFAYGGYPDHYAGCWLEGDVLCVGVTTDDEGIRSIYLDTLAPAKCRIEYRVVKYSYNQLMIFNEVIWSGHAIDPLAEPISLADTCGLNSSGIVTDRNCVEITSEQGYSDELYAALVSFAKDLGADEDIFELEESAITIMPAMEEAVAEEAPAQSPTLAVELPVGLSLNPLRPYFSETYGENVYPNHYAGCWHESTAVLPSSSDADESGEVSMEMSGGLVLHIMLAEEVDEETLAKYRDICMADAAFISDLDFSVVFDRAEYSYNTLRYIKDEAKARYEARVGTEKYLWSGIDEPNNRVILRCEEYDDALRTVVDELTGEFGKSGALFEVTETEVVIAEPHAGSGEVLPVFEEFEESPVEVVLTQSIAIDENPLMPYFEENYGSIPDWYSGLYRIWTDADDPSDHNDHIEIGLTADAPESFKDDMYSLFPFRNIKFTEQKYSYNTLQSFEKAALERTRESGMLTSGGIDEYANQAYLNVTPSLSKSIPEELTDMLDELAAEMGLGSDVYSLAVVLEPDEPAVEYVVIDEDDYDIITYPIAEPQTSPETADTAGLLCLLFSSLSAAGIIIGKRGK